MLGQFLFDNPQVDASQRAVGQIEIGLGKLAGVFGGGSLFGLFALGDFGVFQRPLGSNRLPRGAGQTDNHRHGDQAGGRQAPFMSPGKLLHPIPLGRRAGVDRLVAQIMFDVGGQVAGRFVTPGAVFFHGPQDDPVEFAFEAMT